MAAMSPKRAAVTPDLPTTGEQGIAGVEATVWNGFLFPKGTPKPIVQKMNTAIEKMIANPDMQKKMGDGARDHAAGSAHAEYFAKFLQEESNAGAR